MFASNQYELIDFGNRKGNGFKLERFGSVVVARPAPPADNLQCRHPQRWRECGLEYQLTADQGRGGGNSGKGRWSRSSELPDPWQLRHGKFVMRLKPTPFGHLGVFAEQQENWDWIDHRVRLASGELKVLNLFAYTGGSTLAAAAAGAAVTHVDSARNVVQWARENARLSGLQDRPIRWITEDSSRFVQRELKRGNRYDAIILDPPSFGHGPKGEVWKIDRDLLRLLRDCRQLLSDQPEFILLTCHSPGFGPAELQATVCDSIFGTCSTQVIAKPLGISTAQQRTLHAGCVVRWPR